MHQISLCMLLHQCNRGVDATCWAFYDFLWDLSGCCFQMFSTIWFDVPKFWDDQHHLTIFDNHIFSVLLWNILKPPKPFFCFVFQDLRIVILERLGPANSNTQLLLPSSWPWLQQQGGSHPRPMPLEESQVWSLLSGCKSLWASHTTKWSWWAIEACQF